jgi:hypothetical protein
MLALQKHPALVTDKTKKSNQPQHKKYSMVENNQELRRSISPQPWVWVATQKLEGSQHVSWGYNILFCLLFQTSLRPKHTPIITKV